MVRILAIRHAIALDRDTAAANGIADESRALTQKGMEKMSLAATGLTRIVTVDAIYSSPLLRARQTAEILATACKIPRFGATDALRPDAGSETLTRWLQKHYKGARTIALVGHEPDLGAWVSSALAGSESFVTLKKGAVCAIEFRAKPAAGAARLCWCMTPAQLRRLSR
jgi:phosphohistidine phosphatase